MSELEQVCTFYLEKHFFGMSVREVQEIIRYHAMTRVPLAKYEIRGLINLRGQIVTAIDMRRRLGLSERPEGEEPMNVVISSGDEAFSLLVDRIGDVLEMAEEAFEPPPETIDANIRRLLQGVYKLEHQLLLILDTEKVIRLNDREADEEE